MRALLISAAAAALLWMAAPAAAQEAQERPDREPEVLLVVEGFACEMCAARLAKGVLELEGVEAVDGHEWKEGRLALWTRDGAELEPALLERTVEKAGFKLKEVQR